MGDGEDRPPGQRRPGGPAFVLVTAKLRHPVLRPGTVGRPGLIGRLAGDSPRPVVSVAAPPGFGKTTLLAQWAESSGRPFAWVSVEEPDNDPKVLLTYVAEALSAVAPISGRVFGALASPGSSVPGSVVPRLGAAFAALTAAELRLLPLLATHLSLAEIAAELALSPNTVKSQAASVYRKLMATSRSQAVARSRELAPLEG